MSARNTLVIRAMAAVLTFGASAASAQAQGQMSGMPGHQRMMGQQGMNTAMMAQMQTMMQRTDLMVERTQQMSQFAKSMTMGAPGVHNMHLMTENLSMMSVQAKGLTTQMHELMANEKAMGDATMHRELGTMQKSLSGMLDNMERMTKSMEKMQQTVPAPARP